MMTPQGSPTVVLINSTRDQASINIANGLRRGHGFESTKIMLMGNPIFQKDSLLLATIDSEIINPPDLDAYFNPQAYIFLSRHWAESGKPAVTAHTTGNFTAEESLGARPKEIGRINPDLLKNYMIALEKRRKDLEGYQITIEATHHGPTSLEKPVLFVELGASEKNWGDENAGQIIGDALVETLTQSRSWDKVAMAFGGTHYPEKFNKLILESDFALSAVVSKYYLENIDDSMFAQILQKTMRFPRYAAVDWKGMGQQKERIVGLAKQFGIEIVKL